MYAIINSLNRDSPIFEAFRVPFTSEGAKVTGFAGHFLRTDFPRVLVAPGSLGQIDQPSALR